MSMGKVIVLVTLLCHLNSCAVIRSAFDDVYRIWTMGEDIQEVDMPKGFVVKPTEVYSLVDPMQKLSWYIYADKDSYYLVSAQTLVSGFNINSVWAKDRGVKIKATSRSTYNKILKAIERSKTMNFISLKESLNGIYNKE